LVLVSGVEPHLHWTTFADCIVECARKLKCDVVVTLLSSLAALRILRLPDASNSQDRSIRALRAWLA
jgi:hypothetical protein